MNNMAGSYKSIKYLGYEEIVCGESSSSYSDMFISPYFLHNFILENKLLLVQGMFPTYTWIICTMVTVYVMAKIFTNRSKRILKQLEIGL